MMRRISKKLAIAWIPAVLALGLSLPSHAQTLSAFDIGASPNPVGDGFYTTLTGFVLGSPDGATPDGSIDFFISGDPTDCNNYQTDIGTGTVNSSGIATVSYYTIQSGTFPICGNYTANTSGYAPATAGPFVLTVYAPTTILVYVPGASVPGATITFNVVLTTPSGQPAPTGTIQLEDPANGNAVVGGPTNVGTIIVNGQSVLGATFATALTSNQYLAVYNGDGNYETQQVQGTIFLENPLTSISPASFIAGASIPSTSSCTLATGGPGLQVTLNGLGFNSGTTAQINVGGSWQPLMLISGDLSSATQIFGCIPATALATAASLQVETSTAGVTGGPVIFQVYAPYSVNTAVSSNPSAFAYGSNLTALFSGTATRTASTDAAVPAGTVTFGLTGISPASPLVTLGTGQLTQVAAAGTYQNPSSASFDTNSSQKLIAADLNGDGYVDVVGMPGTYYGSPAASAYLQVFLSTGDNAFQTEQQVFSGCAAQDFAVGDINGDSIPDLVVVCPGVSTPGFSNPLQAYYMLGNGDGSFQAPVAFGTGSFVSSPTQVVLGWFNNDGYNDIAVIDGVDGYLQIISPILNTYDNYVYFNTGYGPVFSAGAADFNQDGLTDIVLAEYSQGNSSGAILPLINAGSGNSFSALAPTQFSASAYYLWNMAITDVNGDGYPDVAIADPGEGSDSSDPGNVLIFENDQTGNLPLTETYQLTSVGAVAGAPFPIVGQPSNAAVAPGWNLVYTAYGSSNGDIFVGELQRQNATTWTQVGSPTDTGTYPLPVDGVSPPGFIVTGDMNGDGYLDFAATGFIADDSAPSGSLDQLVPFYYGNDAQVTLSNSSQLPTPGTYSLSMTYPGNQLYQANNTATATITISQGPVTGSVSGPGSISYGSQFTLNAAIVGVSGGALPTGSVTFSDCTNPDNPVALGSMALTPSESDSVASLLVTQTLTAGTHYICISYTGDLNYLAASTSNFPSTSLVVNGEAISLSLTSSAASGVTTAGAMVTFQAQDPGTPLPAGETITFTGLPVAVNPVAVVNSSGVASFSYGAFAQGTYSIQANYPGDTVYAAAQSPIYTLTVNPSPVTVNLTSSANPVIYPTLVNLTANATSGGLGVPTGGIAFDDNGGLLSSVPLTIVNGNSGLVAGNTYANNGQTNIVTVTGDFNHDGKPDIATLQSNSDSTVTLVVALGNGDGTFQTPIVYGTTSGTTAIDTSSNSMVAADLTGSGYSDSLVIGASDGNIAVLLYNSGNTAGILNSSQTLNYPGAVGVATGNFTNNGLQDIAVISENSVAMYLNQGSGGFPTGPSWSANSPYMYSDFTGIAVADYNQDGYADIAISDDSGISGPDVTVFLYNPGGSTFSAPVTYPVGVSATGIAAGNLNNDAYPDLAVLSSADNTVDVLINNQSGGFPSGTIYGAATNPTGIAIADFNGDGFADIAITGNGTGTGSGTSILLSSSTGAMTGEMLLPTTGGSSVAAADFNNDGNTDLAVGSTGVTIFLDSGAQAIDPSVALTAGTQSLTAVYTPGGGSTFAGSTSSILSQVVNQAVPVLTWANPAAINYGTPLSATQLDAAPPVGIPGTLSYNPGLGTILTAGTHQLAVSFNPLDAVDYQSVTQFVNITVNQDASTISWSNPAAITYGTALSATQLNATASVPGTFAYDPAPGTVLTAGTHQLAVTFTPTDTVDYQGSSATVNIAVNQASPTVSWTNPAAISYGTALGATQLDATASVPGVLTYSPPAGTVLTAGSHQLSVTFAPTDGTDYAAVTKNVSIVVGQASTNITWAAPSAITYGTALSAAQLDATASVPGTFAYNPALGTVLTGGAHTLGVTFTPTDSTDYQGATASVSIQVSQATPTITWTNPTAIGYGTALGATQLDATASTAGTFTYTPAAGTTLTAGSHTLNVSFAPTDTTDYTTASGSVTIQVNQATPVITWTSPGNISYGTALSSAQLDATATPSGGTFTYNPAAGTILPVGTQTLSVTYVPTDTTDYATATATTTVNVITSFTLTAIAPTSAPYGSGITTVTLTGTGFTQNSVVQLNGTAISTTFVSPTQLTAQIPASFFQQLSPGTITVFDTVKNVTTSSIAFSVTLPNLEITFSGPSTAAPGEQPTLNLVMSQPYPIDIQGTMTLTVDPLAPGGPTDPSVQFSTGGTTYNFTIPAGSTTTPSVQIQSGTLSATITVTLTLEANGQDIEPPSIVPVVVSVPNAAPVITSATLTRSGNTLTVTIQGYSSTRDMSLATFDFTAASGSSISNPDIDVDVASEFTTWYASDTSVQYGSSFSYSQVFNLNNDSSTIGSVSVVLTNSVGQSNQVTAQ